MWKKALLLFSLFAFVVVIAAPADVADARRSFSSGKKSFNQTPKKSDSNVSKSSTTNNSNGASSAAGANRGFFSGGSMMKGLMIGGLAGMLFGGMFAGMGAFGDILGLLINVAALFLLFVLFRSIYDRFKQRRQQPPEQPGPRNW